VEIKIHDLKIKMLGGRERQSMGVEIKKTKTKKIDTLSESAVPSKRHLR
jgi:hypothetical protein